jgi:hypothetical protein
MNIPLRSGDRAVAPWGEEIVGYSLERGSKELRPIGWQFGSGERVDIPAESCPLPYAGGPAVVAFSPDGERFMYGVGGCGWESRKGQWRRVRGDAFRHASIRLHGEARDVNGECPAARTRRVGILEVNGDMMVEPWLGGIGVSGWFEEELGMSVNLGRAEGPAEWDTKWGFDGTTFVSLWRDGSLEELSAPPRNRGLLMAWLGESRERKSPRALVPDCVELVGGD